MHIERRKLTTGLVYFYTSYRLISCLSVFLFFFKSTNGQSPSILSIAKRCSQTTLKKNLFNLASEKMEGRLMASHGDTLASLFVASEFKKAGLIAPYNGTYFQAIKAQKKIIQGNLSIGNKSYAYTDGWKMFPLIPIAIEGAEIVFSGYNDADSLTHYVLSHGMNNKAVIVSEALMLKLLENNTIDSVEAIWKSRGIVAIIWSGKVVDKTIDYIKRRWYVGQYVNDLLDPIFDPGTDNTTAMPEIGLHSAVLQALLNANGISSEQNSSTINTSAAPVLLREKLASSITVSYREVIAPNVIGVLKGKDTTLPVVVLSAHHDHDGKSATDVYYGAVDNASGTVAVIEIARLLQLAEYNRLQPKRTIVFASFTGEERTELGSSYYVNHPLFPLTETYGVLNIDMMGRVDTFYSGKRADSMYAYFLVKDTAHNFRKSLLDANRVLGELTLDAHYEDPRFMRRRLEGSDQFPFYVKGIPFVRIDCGFAKDYHQPTDTPDKINYELLVKQTKLAFMTLWNIANE